MQYLIAEIVWTIEMLMEDRKLNFKIIDDFVTMIPVRPNASQVTRSIMCERICLACMIG